MTLSELAALSELARRVDAGAYKDDRASCTSLFKHGYWLFLRWLLVTGRLDV